MGTGSIKKFSSKNGIYYAPVSSVTFGQVFVLFVGGGQIIILINDAIWHWYEILTSQKHNLNVVHENK